MIFKKARFSNIEKDKDDTPKTNTEFIDQNELHGRYSQEFEADYMDFENSQNNCIRAFSSRAREIEMPNYIKRDQKFEMLESSFKVPQDKLKQPKNAIFSDADEDLLSMSSLFCLCNFGQARLSNGYSNIESKQLSKSDINLAILKNYDYEIVVKDNPISGHQYTVFKCTYKGCNKEMETTWNMLDHARMHKGIKPYICCFCNKRFTQKGNMRKHAKLHLTPHVDARRKFKCEFCGGGFTEKYNLMTHIKSFHQAEQEQKMISFGCIGQNQGLFLHGTM